MKTVVKNFTNLVILLSVIAIILGVAFLVEPGISLITVGIMVGAYMILQGVVLVILDIKAWRLFIPFEGMLKGILSILLGVLLINNPESIATYIGIALGIYFIVYGFSGVKLAVSLRFTGTHWIAMLIISIVYIIFGCFTLYSPIFSAFSLTVTIGAVLIVYSIANIVYMFIIKRNAKAVETLIAEKKNLPGITKNEVEEAEEA